ncbi:MAG TPA: hypothetical protein VFY16_01780, partial [Gemmatimonadaceae bacterium]|nr:hypothetical protein [Gemmatimonadaceae bacterium]
MTHRDLTAPTLESGPDGSPMLRLRADDGARADVHLHGAHVTSWIPAGESEDRLFLSARSKFGAGASIRGGIPVIFPQFAALGPLPRHGFARTSGWELVGVEREPTGAVATFRLVDSPATRAIWPHPFLAELTVAVGGARLRVALAVTNTGREPIAFTAALHSYVRVRDVERSEVHGLRGLAYRDSAAGGREDVDHAPALVVSGEMNRVYFEAPPELELREPDRVLRLHAAG